jgi:hypothetical protein
MTSKPAIDPVVDDWLSAGPSTLSDQVLRAAMADIHVTRQRAAHRRALPWATGTPFRIATAVALVVVTAVVTVALLRSAPSTVASPSPSPLIPADRGAFTPTGTMLEPRDGPTATLLQDGSVLVVGGYRDDPDPDPGLAETWDPVSGQFTAAGELPHGREGHAAILLDDGRVLVVGGSSTDRDASVNALRSAETWDPRTRTFIPTGSLATGRTGAILTLLADGRVLVHGGTTAVEAPAADAEIWDPTSGTFGPAGPVYRTEYPDGVQLADGRILRFRIADAFIWDPATSSSTAAGSLTPVTREGFTATLLRDGRVLIAGGSECIPIGSAKTASLDTALGGCGVEQLDQAELWAPVALSFDPTGPLAVARTSHAATLLQDGRVLIVGAWHGADNPPAEVFELK